MSKQFDKQFKENAVQYYLEHRELGSPCLSCGFDICTEGFKTGTIFNLCHIASPYYIV